MPSMTWDLPGTRYFETGVDQGVLYPSSGAGIPWNGLVSVTESIEAANSTPIYLDGEKIKIAQTYGDFAATIEAYSAPVEFSAYDGTPFGLNGLGFGLQPKKPFGFSYRTLVGNDEDREDFGYKIHLVYNAYASSAEITHTSIGESVDPVTMSWDISTIPARVTGKRPTAHLVIDSRYVDSALLGIIEGYLYGANGVIPMLPTAQQISDLFAVWTAIGIDGPVNYQGVYSAGYTTLTNLATNPSFETASGTVEVRRNFNVNPRFAGTANGSATVGGWALPPSAGTWGASDGLVNVASTLGTGAIVGPYEDAVIPAAPGEVWTVSRDFSVPTGYPAMTLRLAVVPYTSAPAAVLAEIVYGPTVTIQPGQTMRLSATSAVLGETVAGIRSIPYSAEPAVSGRRLQTSNALVERSPVSDTYFDGSAPLKILRNLSTNPNAVSAAGFASNNVYWTVTRNIPVPAPHPQGISTAAKSQRTSSSGNSDDRNVLSMFNIDALATTGPARNIGAWVYVTAPGYQGYLKPGGNPTPLPANTWVWLTDSFSAGGYSAAYINRIDGAVAPSSDVAYITGVTVLTGAIPTESLWGGMTPAQGFGAAWEGAANASPSYMYDSDLTSSWMGAVNNSQSSLTGAGVPTTATGNLNQRVAISSTRWSESGSRSFRIFNKTVVTGSTQIIVYTFTAGDVGKTFTVLATYHQEGVAGAQTSQDRRILIQSNPGALSVAAPDATGTTPLSLIFTLTAAGAVRLGGSGALSANAFWDNLLIIEGVYTGPYFDGSSPNFVYKSQETDPYWAATPNASVSNAKIYDNLPEAAAENDARLIGSELWVRVNGAWRNKGVVPQIT